MEGCVVVYFLVKGKEEFGIWIKVIFFVFFLCVWFLWIGFWGGGKEGMVKSVRGILKVGCGYILLNC